MSDITDNEDTQRKPKKPRVEGGNCCAVWGCGALKLEDGVGVLNIPDEKKSPELFKYWCRHPNILLQLLSRVEQSNLSPLLPVPAPSVPDVIDGSFEAFDDAKSSIETDGEDDEDGQMSHSVRMDSRMMRAIFPTVRMKK